MTPRGTTRAEDRRPWHAKDCTILRMAGSLSGSGSPSGSLWHAVPPAEGEATGRQPALCGRAPVVAWGEEEGEEVTCRICLRALDIGKAKAMLASSQEGAA